MFFFMTDVTSSNFLSNLHLQVKGKYLGNCQEHCCEICYGSSVSPEGEPFDEPKIALVLLLRTGSSTFAVSPSSLRLLSSNTNLIYAVLHIHSQVQLFVCMLPSS